MSKNGPKYSFLEIFGHGGGKIKRKSILLVLMLLALTLTISSNAVFATTNTTTNISDQNSGQNLDKITVENSDQKTAQTAAQNSAQSLINDSYKAAGSPSSSVNKAAGSATTTTSISFTKDQINSAAWSVNLFISKYKRLPNYVTIGKINITMPQFLKLMTQNVININSGSRKSVPLTTAISPTNTTETIKTGNLYKSTYISTAITLTWYITAYKKVPSYISTHLGKIKYQTMIYTFSRILSFQKAYNRLPNYVTVVSWAKVATSEGSGSTSTSSSSTSSSNSTVNSALAKYLVATTNAQSTNSTIIKLANSITSRLTSTYAKATAIFNWVRNNLSYSYYYNSKKGALGALSSRSANCCDTAHLVVALSRAAGIPALYQHGYCHFSDGWFGHVWARMYVNGKWYYADAISDYNTFGSINNWNLSTVKIYGTYAALPF